MRTKFESTILDENIVDVPALRFRRKEDTIIRLKEKREVACVLNDDHYVERDEETGEITRRGREIHFVLEMMQLKAIRKLKDSTMRPMRVFIEGKYFNVRFLDLHIHPGKIINV